MAESRICPVCRGIGKVIEPIKGNWEVPKDDPPDVTCHRCGGIGWVIVRQEA